MFTAKFQTFDDPAGHKESAARVAALRAELEARSLDGFIVPRADRQQNEYLPAREERLPRLTAFPGSAGPAVVLADRAAAFVDGRYTVQAQTQLDASVFTIVHLVETPPGEWLKQNLKDGERIRSHPWLHTAEGAALRRNTLTK